MNPQGYYDTTAVPPRLVPARIRELKMDSLMPLVTEDPKTGAFHERSPQSLVNSYGSVVRSIEGVVGTKGSVIRGLGSPDAVLEHRMFGLREDLPAVYDVEVDEWLYALAGEAHYQAMTEWIGHALDFTGGPICALSIAGPPSIGKGLLMQGLAECVDSKLYTETQDFGQFQGMLDRTPWMFLNEGLPSRTPGTKELADSFRGLIDGSPTIVNQKYMPPMRVYNPVRILIASNSDAVVTLLAGGRDLTPEDQQALALRLYHFEAGRDAAEYLKMKGGFLHTGRAGRRWVRGPDGAPSDEVLAQHFMFLYQNRPPVPSGNRLLMQGALDADIMRKLATRGGSSPEIIETIVSLIENQTINDGLVIVKGEVYVTSSGVTEHHRTAIARKTGNNIGLGAITKTLRSIEMADSRRESGPYTILLESGINSKNARWFKLDVARLMDEAVTYGYRCSKLRQIVAEKVRLDTAWGRSA
jgi:hypothetical protein